MQKWSGSKDTQRICRLKREVPQASWRPVAGTETAGPTGQGDPFARCRIQRLLSVTWCTRESCFLYPNTKYSLSKDSPYAQLCVIMKWGFRYRFAFLVGLVALTFAGGAFAQSSDQPEPVPRELAAALIGSGFGGESTDFFVGTLPSGLPDDFTLPEGAQVLGGVSTDGFGFPLNPFGSSSPPERRIIVADVPSRSSSVKARHDSTLVGRGWSRMTSVPPNQQVCQRRQSSSTALFCREDTVLRRFISSQGNEGARLKVEYRTGGPMSRFCNRPQSSAGLMRDVPRPSLEPPSEAAIVLGRRRIGSFSSYPRVESDLSSVELASHYADQLRDQGWTLEARKEDRGAVNQSWRLEDDSGQTWRDFLVVMPFPGTLEKKILFHIAQQWDRQRPNRASPGWLRGAALPHAEGHLHVLRDARGGWDGRPSVKGQRLHVPLGATCLHAE
jgi:hypothetical protein